MSAEATPVWPDRRRDKPRDERAAAPARPPARRSSSCSDVTKVYPGGHMALDRVSLAIGRGEFVFLVGPTGCGKSTLIKMLIRELAATEGAVKIAGRDIGALPEKKIPQLRRNIGTVFQDFKLLPDRTVYDNVAYALQVIGASRAEIREQVPETLRLVGLSTKLHSYPDQLSGGEQQRVSSPAPSSTTRRCCSPTSPAATSTRSPRSGSCSCSTGSTRPARRSSSSPTTARWSTTCAAAWSSSTRAASSATRSAAATPRSRRPSSACGCGPRWASAPRATQTNGHDHESLL